MQPATALLSKELGMWNANWEPWALLFKCGVHPRGPLLSHCNKVRTSALKASSPQLKIPLQRLCLIQSASIFGFINFSGNFLCIYVSSQAIQGITSTLQASAPTSFFPPWSQQDWYCWKYLSGQDRQCCPQANDSIWYRGSKLLETQVVFSSLSLCSLFH